MAKPDIESVTFNIPPELMQLLEKRAHELGVSVETLAQQTLAGGLMTSAAQVRGAEVFGVTPESDGTDTITPIPNLFSTE